MGGAGRRKGGAAKQLRDHSATLAARREGAGAHTFRKKTNNTHTHTTHARTHTHTHTHTMAAHAQTSWHATGDRSRPVSSIWRRYLFSFHAVNPKMFDLSTDGTGLADHPTRDRRWE